MKKQLLCLSFMALLSLIACKYNHEIEPKTKPTSEPKANQPAGPSGNSTGEPAAKYVAITDAYFRAYLKKEIPEAFKEDSLNVAHKDVKGLLKIDISRNKIKDLREIQYFTNLETLDCSDNALKNLDLSKNVALTDLYCSDNELKSLDLSQNARLVNLTYCLDFELSSLKPEHISLGDLMSIRIVYPSSGKIMKLAAIPDDAFRAYLKERMPQAFLSFRDSYMLNITHEKVKKLPRISLEESGVKDLTGVEYFTDLSFLDCHSNKIKSLDLSQNKNLDTLICHSNKLISLNVSGAESLKLLYCDRNELESLDVSQNKDLERLDCYYNELISLNVNGAESLKKLHCNSNEFESLDVSGAKALKELLCSSNKLTSLNVSQNKDLERLDCYHNKLTSLNVNGAESLKELHCDYNELESLDVSGAKALKELLCNSNKLQRLVLPQDGGLGTLSYCKNPGFTEENIVGTFDPSIVDKKSCE